MIADVEYWNSQKSTVDALAGVRIKSITIDRGAYGPNKFLVLSMRFAREHNEYLIKHKHGVWELKTRNVHGTVVTNGDVNFFRVALRQTPPMIITDVVDAATVKKMMKDGVKIKIKR